MKYKVKFDYYVSDVMFFIIPNFFLMIFTLGLAFPFVILNFIKLITNNIELESVDELGKIEK